MISKTPWQQTIEPAIIAMLAAFAIAAAPIVSQALSPSHDVDWRQTIITAATAGFVAALTALGIYIRAHYSGPLATSVASTIDAAASSILAPVATPTSVPSPTIGNAPPDAALLASLVPTPASATTDAPTLDVPLAEATGSAL